MKTMTDYHKKYSDTTEAVKYIKHLESKCALLASNSSAEKLLSENMQLTTDIVNERQKTVSYCATIGELTRKLMAAEKKITELYAAVTDIEDSPIPYTTTGKPVKYE